MGPIHMWRSRSWCNNNNNRSKSICTVVKTVEIAWVEYHVTEPNSTVRDEKSKYKNYWSGTVMLL
jgi:hypothetical protein